MKKNALLSVYHKTGIVQFAQFLINRGYTIYASGGTSKHLTEAGIANIDVATLVGGGAILGHKVVTLSRELHAGLLADAVTEIEEMEKLGLPFIDLVCVDMYPLKEAINTPNPDEKDIISKTDIGGPTMLSAGAKSRRIVICDPVDREKVMHWIDAGQPESDQFLRMLAAKADYIVSGYRLLSAEFHSKGIYTGVMGERAVTLRYGENAHQSPAYLVKTDTGDPLAIHKFKIHAGNPSMINITDVDRGLRTMTYIGAALNKNTMESFNIALGLKHGNACGASFCKNELRSIMQMLTGNLKSIFGGTVIVNFMITSEHANLLRMYGTGSNGKNRPLDVVVASDISPEAIEILKRKNDRCLIMTNKHLEYLNEGSIDNSILQRQVRGGWIQQPSPTFILDLQSEEITKYFPFKIPNDEAQRYDKDTLLSWAICATSNSNTITLVKDGMLIGNGVGQQDRVEAAELAIKRAIEAGHDISFAVAASDSFFPYPDAPQKLIDAGVCRVLATSGSVNDEVVIKLFKDEQRDLIHIPDRVGRGFSNH